MSKTVNLKAVVIAEDKATMHLGVQTDSGTTYQSITNPVLLDALRQAHTGLSGQPCEINITICPAE